MSANSCEVTERREFLSPDELADKLNVPLSWVYARTREKGGDAIPRRKLGRYLRFDLDDVLEWLSRHYH